MLELYAPVFPTPLFYGSDFGIIPERSLKPALSNRLLDLSPLFKRSEFATFFQMLLPQAQYGTWFADRVKHWTPEDWRLFAAALLYRGLREYQDGKDSFGWQRESADMACVLEALFTAEDKTRRDIGKRLQRRLGVLLSSEFPTVEGDVKTLYEQRSAFVHGSFFAHMAQASKQWDHGLSIPDFIFLPFEHDSSQVFTNAAMLRSSSPGVSTDAGGKGVRNPGGLGHAAAGSSGKRRSPHVRGTHRP